MREPEIIRLEEKKLAGKRMRMSLAQNRTFGLWQNFMKEQAGISNRVGTDRISLQVYDSPAYWDDFDPSASFEKWAAVKVAGFENLPEGMEGFTLPGGLYAVFPHKGGPATGPDMFRYIFQSWLPSSECVLDDRPHFEVLDEKYKQGDPESEEEIWIPVRQKNR
jgi:AraC family transcriptional regulator